MKAIAKCPKCNETITTDCRGCIDAGTAFHTCKGEEEPEVVDVEWKVYPETESELNQLEEVS